MICNNKRWRWLAFIKITWIPNVKKIITETEIPRLAGGERDAAGAGPGLRGGETDWLSTTSTGGTKLVNKLLCFTNQQLDLLARLGDM